LSHFLTNFSSFLARMMPRVVAFVPLWCTLLFFFETVEKIPRFWEPVRVNQSMTWSPLLREFFWLENRTSWSYFLFRTGLLGQLRRLRRFPFGLFLEPAPVFLPPLWVRNVFEAVFSLDVEFSCLGPILCFGFPPAES